jgi:hypothetical protein
MVIGIILKRCFKNILKIFGSFRSFNIFEVTILDGKIKSDNL